MGARAVCNVAVWVLPQREQLCGPDPRDAYMCRCSEQGNHPDPRHTCTNMLVADPGGMHEHTGARGMHAAYTHVCEWFVTALACVAGARIPVRVVRADPAVLPASPT